MQLRMSETGANVAGDVLVQEMDLCVQIVKKALAEYCAQVGADGYPCRLAV